MKSWCAVCDRPSRVLLSRNQELVRRADGELVKVIAERWICRACPKSDGNSIGLVLDVPRFHDERAAERSGTDAKPCTLGPSLTETRDNHRTRNRTDGDGRADLHPPLRRQQPSRVGDHDVRHLGGAVVVGAADLAQQIGDDADQAAALHYRQRSDLVLKLMRAASGISSEDSTVMAGADMMSLTGTALSSVSMELAPISW